MSLPLISDNLEGRLEVVVVDPLDKVATALDLDSASAFALAEVGQHSHSDHVLQFVDGKCHFRPPFDLHYLTIVLYQIGSALSIGFVKFSDFFRMAGLANHPRGYAPIEAGVGADVGELALDSMLLGADTDVKVVSLYSDSEQVGIDSNLHGLILSTDHCSSLQCNNSTLKEPCQVLG